MLRTHNTRAGNLLFLQFHQLPCLVLSKPFTQYSSWVDPLVVPGETIIKYKNKNRNETKMK
jgi:hypothetical protein